MSNVADTQGAGGPRIAGPAERAKLAGLFEAIGNATNSTIINMPEFEDETVRRQMTHTFASVGGFVMYADILRQGTRQDPSDAVEAIIQLGRALSHRIEVKPS